MIGPAFKITETKSSCNSALLLNRLYQPSHMGEGLHHFLTRAVENPSIPDLRCWRKFFVIVGIFQGSSEWKENFVLVCMRMKE